MKILSAFRSVFVSPFSYFIFVLMYLWLAIAHNALRTGDEFGLDASFISGCLQIVVSAYFIFLVLIFGRKIVGTASSLFPRLAKLWLFSLLAAIIALIIRDSVIYVAFNWFFHGVTSEGRGAYVWLTRAFVEKYLVYDFCLWPIWIVLVLGYPFVELWRIVRKNLFSVAGIFFLTLLCASILLSVFENPFWLTEKSPLVLFALLAGIGKLVYLSLFIFLLSMIKSKHQELEIGK
jgi:hypothetical protein